MENVICSTFQFKLSTIVFQCSRTLLHLGWFIMISNTFFNRFSKLNWKANWCQVLWYVCGDAHAVYQHGWSRGLVYKEDFLTLKVKAFNSRSIKRFIVVVEQQKWNRKKQLQMLSWSQTTGQCSMFIFFLLSTSSMLRYAALHWQKTRYI